MSDAAHRLPRPLDDFVEQQVQSGAYSDREAVIEAAVQRLKAEAEADQAKMIRLNSILADAAARLDRGEGEEVTDLKAYFDAIEAEALSGVETQAR